MKPAKSSGKRSGQYGEAPATRKVSAARLCAFEILRRVEEEDAFASVLLAETDTEMLASDRALCYELVLGVLRRRLWLDHLIEHYAGRAPSRLDAPVRRALHLGLYQLRFLSRIPPSAAVNESVNLAYRSRVSSAASFINAVLRRALKEPEFDPAQSIADPVERLSVETSHPRWLIERWTKAFGRDAAAAFARANNETPVVAFRVVAARAKGRNVLEELRAAAEELSPSRIAEGAWRIHGAGAHLRKLAQEGLIYIQDEASQLVAQVLDAKAQNRVLDVCAAPGSKTTHIADRWGELQVIVAGDLYLHRLRAVLESADRQQARAVRCVAYDATQRLPFAEGSFDRVLVDAPCTGTGTLRRNPEIRWRISEQDIRDLSLRQRAILKSASRMVRPDGGRLVYSTCSVEPEENESVVASFLEENSAFRQVSVPVPERLLSAGGAARTWPQRDHADGFFIAAFARRS